MSAEKASDQAWPINGERGIDIGELVELYQVATKMRDDDFASRLVAEAIASTTTALSNPAAEATATVAADAVRGLARGGESGPEVVAALGLAQGYRA